MTAFDLLAVPSIEEPLGLVAVEALAAGTPVVATRTGGLPEIVHDQKCGVLVPPKKPAAIADSIIKLANDRALRSKMGIYGQEFVYEEFNTANLCDQVEEIYFRLANRTCSNAA